MMSKTRMHKLLLAALFVAATAGLADRAGACVGDCDENGAVAISELVLGVNIATDLRPLDECPSFDGDEDGSLSINEVVLGVNNSLGSCAPFCGDFLVNQAEEECDDGNQIDGDGCQSTCKLPVCGDGVVDLIVGETCDDGNTGEGTGQTCPANCRIEPCEPSGETLAVNVDFATDPAELLISGLTLFVRYPDGVVGIPGRDNDPSVLERVTSNSFSVTPNDLNYGLTAVLLDPTFVGVPEGTAIAVTFDLCTGASAPSPEDFACTVEDAADVSLNPVTEQVSCAVALP